MRRGLSSSHACHVIVSSRFFEFDFIFDFESVFEVHESNLRAVDSFLIFFLRAQKPRQTDMTALTWRTRILSLIYDVSTLRVIDIHIDYFLVFFTNGPEWHKLCILSNSSEWKMNVRKHVESRVESY